METVREEGFKSTQEVETDTPVVAGEKKRTAYNRPELTDLGALSSETKSAALGSGGDVGSLP